MKLLLAILSQLHRPNLSSVKISTRIDRPQQILNWICLLAAPLSILVVAEMAAAQTCDPSNTSSPGIDYISDEVGNNNSTSRSTAESFANAWKGAADAAGLTQATQWRPSVEQTNISNPYLLFTSSGGVDVAAELRDMTNLTDCTGSSSTGLANVVLSPTLQSNSPRPSSLYSASSQTIGFWNENAGSGASRNAVLFTFSQPVKAFGAWFGDLETRPLPDGVPAIVRLLDASGNRIGGDIIVNTTTSPLSSCTPVPLPSPSTGNTDPIGCGNKTTRWIGFVDNNAAARVKQMVVIVGDNAGNGNIQSISFIGATIREKPGISGKVFEDPNYGGGAGRPLVASTTSPRDGATVELYRSDGTYISQTTTANGGKYSFTNLGAGDYKVRVVNSTVTSSRTGYVNTLMPVQTFRTDGSTGTVVPVIDRVGGEMPAEVDAAANSGSQTLTDLNSGANEVQSIASVKVSNSDVTGVDFGFNFDTIVNTNDSGQGSLRQFITNSNALTNTGLDQAANSNNNFDPAAGEETSIFMIPAGQLTGNVAIINLTSVLPTITATNTRLDGGSQTANIGDTNSGQIGTGGTVGVDGIALAKFDKPEVEIKGKSYLLTATGANTQIKNIAFNAHRIAVSGANSLVENNLVGMDAKGANDKDTTAKVGGHGIEITSGSDIKIKHNYVRVNESGIRRNGGNPSRTIIESNEVDSPSSLQTITYDGILLISSGSSEIIRYNLVKNMYGAGVEIGWGGALTNTLLNNNTFQSNGYINATNFSKETMGVVVRQAGNSTITLSKNIITGNSGPGVLVMESRGVKITQNSIFLNGASGNGAGLSIDLDSATGIDPNNYGAANGVTPNDGTKSTTLPNHGMDYPVITAASLTAPNTLNLKGYVGKEDTIGGGDTDFAGAVIEFFSADDDGNNNGPVFVTTGASNVSRPHGEGKTYLGTCTADGAGKFNCNLTISGSIDTQKITATATDSAGNTSEFSATPNIKASLLIVKRITAINGVAINPNTVLDNQDSTNDDHANWPTNYLVGAIDGGKVKPGDEIEYTIYYLNSGDNSAKGVRICDRLNTNLIFQTQFDLNDSATADKGIKLISGTANPEYLTNASDPDRGFLSTSSTLPTNCNLSGNTTSNLSNNVVVIDVVDSNNFLPGSIGAGNPNNSYGKIQFKVKVKQ